MSVLGTIRPGQAWQTCRGAAVIGMARYGAADMARRRGAVPGKARMGTAGEAWNGRDRSHPVEHGKADKVWFGP